MDGDDLLKLRSDLDVMKYIGDGAIHTAEQVSQFLTMTISYQEKHRLGFCSIFEKESGNFIGQAGLFYLGYADEQADVEIAYRLHKAYWSKGYATELVKALIRWGFDHLPVDKLIAITHPDNIASQKVLKKAGLNLIAERKWHDGTKLSWFETYRNDAIELTPYNTEWPKMADLEIKKLLDLLPKNHVIDIQHVGSTAIPNLMAKPIVDIQIAVDSLIACKPSAIEVLKTLGYEYWAENPDPERLFFMKGMPPFGDKRTHHVHIVEPSSKHWKEKILFRDYLSAHPEVAYDYQRLKQKLASEHPYDREQYTNKKTEFIKNVLKKAAAFYKH